MTFTIKADRVSGLKCYTALDDVTGELFLGASYDTGDVAPFVQICGSEGARVFSLHCPKGFGLHASWGVGARTEVTNPVLGLCGVLDAETSRFMKRPIFSIELVQITATCANVEQVIGSVRWLFSDSDGKPAFIVEASTGGLLKCYCTDATWAYHAFVAAVWFDTKHRYGGYVTANPLSRIAVRVGPGGWNDEWERFYVLCQSGNPLKVHFDVQYPHFVQD